MSIKNLIKAKKLIKSYGLNYYCDKKDLYYSLKPYGDINHRATLYLIQELKTLCDNIKVIKKHRNLSSNYYCLPFEIKNDIFYSYRFIFNYNLISEVNKK